MPTGLSVSVVIPTYNRCASLLRALRSVVGQSVQPAEILVVDDGSEDATERRVRTLFAGVRYIRQDNLGISAARNRGVREAKADWVAFLDSDDEWLPRKLERQLAQLQRDPGYRICHTNEIWIRRGRRVNPMKKHQKSGGWIFEKCLRLCTISPSSVLLHRRVFERVGGFDESLPVCEDYDLWLRLTAVHPVLYLDEPLIVKYGGHEDQLSRSTWGLDRFRIRALEKVVGSPALSAEARRATIEVLLEKIDIYLKGARKRGKGQEVAAYQAKRKCYRKALIQ